MTQASINQRSSLNWPAEREWVRLLISGNASAMNVVASNMLRIEKVWGATGDWSFLMRTPRSLIAPHSIETIGAIQMTFSNQDAKPFAKTVFIPSKIAAMHARDKSIRLVKPKCATQAQRMNQTR